MWNDRLSGAVSVRDELRWCFERDESEIARKNLKKYGKSHSRQIAGKFPTAEWAKANGLLRHGDM